MGFDEVIRQARERAAADARVGREAQRQEAGVLAQTLPEARRTLTRLASGAARALRAHGAPGIPMIRKPGRHFEVCGLVWGSRSNGGRDLQLSDRGLLSVGHTSVVVEGRDVRERYSAAPKDFTPVGQFERRGERPVGQVWLEEEFMKGERRIEQIDSRLPEALSATTTVSHYAVVSDTSGVPYVISNLYDNESYRTDICTVQEALERLVAEIVTRDIR
jgi:hypothetical protein